MNPITASEKTELLPLLLYRFTSDRIVPKSREFVHIWSAGTWSQASYSPSLRDQDNLFLVVMCYCFTCRTFKAALSTTSSPKQERCTPSNRIQPSLFAQKPNQAALTAISDAEGPMGLDFWHLGVRMQPSHSLTDRFNYLLALSLLPLDHTCRYEAAEPLPRIRIYKPSSVDTQKTDSYSSLDSLSWAVLMLLAQKLLEGANIAHEPSSGLANILVFRLLYHV